VVFEQPRRGRGMAAPALSRIAASPMAPAFCCAALLAVLALAVDVGRARAFPYCRIAYGACILLCNASRRACIGGGYGPRPRLPARRRARASASFLTAVFAVLVRQAAQAQPETACTAAPAHRGILANGCPRVPPPC